MVLQTFFGGSQRITHYAQPLIVCLPSLTSLIGMVAFDDLAVASVSSFHRTIPLVCDTLLLVLALYKARALWTLKGFNGSRLVLVLIRDQALYYAM